MSNNRDDEHSKRYRGYHTYDYFDPKEEKLMTNVDYFIDELGRLPHNGIHVTWFTDVDYDEEVVKITMKDRTRKPARSKVQLCPFEDIMAMVDPRLAAKSIINKMYYDFGEHIVDRKLLMIYSDDEHSKRYRVTKTL